MRYSDPSPGYRPDIDGLRAIAVLSVLVFHAFPGVLRGGFVGVDVFFVISGYLISAIIFEGLAGGSFSFPGFYARRIRRIFPALILVMAACFALGWRLLFPNEMEQLGKHILGSSGFVQNYVLRNESGYFDASADAKPLLHIWSLSVEEQFYLAWPFLAWSAWRARWSLPATMAALAAGSFLLSLLGTGDYPVRTFYSPFTRAWEFLAGGLLAWVTTSRRPPPEGPKGGAAALLDWLRSTATPDVRAATGMLLLIPGIWLIDKERGFPGFQALMPVLGTALLISAGMEAWINRRLLSIRWLAGIGLISYPLYLWHWPLLSFLRIVDGGEPALAWRAGAVAASFVLAWLTWRVVERPIRLGKHAGRKTVALASTIAVAACMGYATMEQKGWADREHVRRAAAVHGQLEGPLWKYTSNATCLDRYGSREVRTFGWWFCMTNRDAPPDLLLLGSSFANHLYPGMALHPEIGRNTVLSIGSCSIDESGEAAAARWRDQHPCSAERWQEQRQLIDRVVASGSLRYAILDGLNPVQSPRTMEMIRERIEHLERHKIEVIVFVPHLRDPSVNIRRCFRRALKDAAANCRLDRKEHDALLAGFRPLMDALARTHPQVRFFDQNELVCGPSTCSFVLDGLPVFRDHHGHYSEHASVMLGRKFAAWARVHAPGLLDAPRHR